MTDLTRERVKAAIEQLEQNIPLEYDGRKHGSPNIFSLRDDEDKVYAKAAYDWIEDHYGVVFQALSEREKLLECIQDLSSGGNHWDYLKRLEKHADTIALARQSEAG